MMYLKKTIYLESDESALFNNFVPIVIAMRVYKFENTLNTVPLTSKYTFSDTNVPLPEDCDLQGFIPLEKAFEGLK